MTYLLRAKMKKSFLLGICSCIALSGCLKDSVPDDQVFTLYQNAPSDHGARVGLATFDMKWGERMNHDRCQQFASFLDKEFDADPEVQRLKKKGDPQALGQKHWCEKGRYRE